MKIQFNKDVLTFANYQPCGLCYFNSLPFYCGTLPFSCFKNNRILVHNDIQSDGIFQI